MHGSFLRTLKRTLLFGCFIALCNQALATTVVVPTDDNMIIGARAIVRAKVLSTGSAVEGDRVFTYTRLKIREVLKGQLADRKLVIKEQGGVVADRGSVVFGTPQFTPDEEVILYLTTRPDGSFHTYHMFLGKFSVVTDPQTGVERAVRATPDENITVASVRESDHSRGPITDSMELNPYMTMVRGRLAENLEAARRFEETHYRDVPLLAEPPEYSRLEADGQIHSQYTFLSPTEPARWFDPDTGQPVIFLVNPTGAPSPQAIDDINQAMTAWTGIPGSSLQVVNGGPTGGCYEHQQNTIVFDNCDGWHAPDPSLCAGILASGGFSWDRSQSVVINGTRFYKAFGGHISFNPYARCNFAIHCNVQEIATHELGHALGLGHSGFQDATMFAYAHFDGRCASLKSDDIAGITFMYPSSGGGGGGGPLTIATTSPLTSVRVGTQYVKTIIAFGGTPPYTWTLAAGSGPLPAGLSLSSLGVLSGTPSATGTFNFTVKVSDTASGVAERAFTLTVDPPGRDYNSQFVSQLVPASVPPGVAFTVNVKWNNTGTRAWNGSNGFRLASQNPLNNVNWGGNMVALSGWIVEPGEQLDLDFIAYAPSTPGTYNFQWQCVQDNLLFGQESTNVVIRVGEGGETNDAMFVRQNVITTMTAGQSYPASITFRNTGPTTWSVADYRVGSQNPPENSIWGASRITLPSAVAPAAEVTVNFTVTAPVTLGTYNFQWQMMKTTTGSFGAMPPAVAISVVAPVPNPEVNTASLPAGEVGVNYSMQLGGSGGVLPYSWSIKTGTLPTGVNLNSSSGLLSGVPASAGTFAVTLKLTDGASRTAERALTLVVNPAPPLLAMLTTSLPSAVRSEPFGIGLIATGGVQPYTWSVASGSMPPGMNLNPAAGVLSGVATSSGLFNFTIMVRDQRSTTASTALQLTVVEPVPVPVIAKVKFKAGKKKMTVTGGNFDPAAVLLIDGVETSCKIDGNTIVAKKVRLDSGSHVVRVVNPRNTTSTGYVLNVD